MHLTKRVLPFMICEALKGRTWADMAVFDSPGDVGSIRVEGEGGIFIAVYCDEWDLKRDDERDDKAAESPGAFKLVIEVAASKPVTTEADEEGPVSRLVATDDGLEFMIAFISRQCVDVLTIDQNNPWSAVFREFISNSLLRWSIRRGGPPNDGRTPAARYASCVSILKVSASTMEPPRGQFVSPDHYPVWSRLLELMKTREDLQGLEKMIRAHFEPVDGKELAESVIDGGRMWVSAETMEAIGLAPAASLKFAADAGGAVSGAAVRPDVPLNEADARAWLDAQGPDPSQGPPNAG